MPKTGPFELYSKEYDDWFDRNMDKYEAELRLIRELVPTGRIKGLEIGVGSGKFAKPLDIDFGLEPSSNMALKAKNSGIVVASGAAEALPFKDSEFDLVLMVTTICFVDDVLESFIEAHRVLKNKGLLITAFVDKDSELGISYEKNREQSRFYKDATFFSADEVINFMKKAGFFIDSISQTLMPGGHSCEILNGYGTGAFVGVRGQKS